MKINECLLPKKGEMTWASQTPLLALSLDFIFYFNKIS